MNPRRPPIAPGLPIAIIGNSARPVGSLGNMLHLSQKAKGVTQTFIAFAQGRLWPIVAVASSRPPRKLFGGKLPNPAEPAAAYRDVMEYTAAAGSLAFDAGELDHFAPLFGLRHD